MRAMFKRMDAFELDVAPSAEDALQMLRAHAYDLIFTDVHLPGMSGMDLAVQVRSQHQSPRIPIIALSASAMAVDVQKGMAAGFDKYMTKPVAYNDVQQTLGEFFGEKS